MLARQTRIDWSRVKQELARNEAALSNAACDSSEEIAATFRRRAELLAKRNRAHAHRAATVRVLAFRLASERYGVKLSSIVEVFARVGWCPVPGAAQHVLGVANLRGEVRSVLDLRRLLHLPVAEELNGGVLLAKSGSAELGFWVEEIEEVEHVDEGRWALSADRPELNLGPFVLGVTEKHTVVLDVDAIFDAVTPRGTTITAKSGTEDSFIHKGNISG